MSRLKTRDHRCDQTTAETEWGRNLDRTASASDAGFGALHRIHDINAALEEGSSGRG